MRKAKLTACIILFLAVAANYNWVHAAIVYGASTGTCDTDKLAAAKLRVQSLFGSVESDPWIRCLEQPTLGLGHIIGTTHFAPGLPAVIILSSEGNHLDVIAHEWAHAEYARRVGGLYRTYAVPTWFDEGLAMQVDHRKSYDLSVVASLSEKYALGEVEKVGGFFQPGEQGRFHYAWARCAVSTWLMNHTWKEVPEIRPACPVLTQPTVNPPNR